MINILDISSTDWKNKQKIPVISIGKLNSLLESFRLGTPRLIELESEAGSRLQLGLGGSYACAQYIGPNNLPPYLTAKAESVTTNHDIEFLLGGTPTPVVPAQCISFETALAIAQHFFITSLFDPTVEWQEN